MTTGRQKYRGDITAGLLELGAAHPYAARKKKQTRSKSVAYVRAQFLSEMARCIPWGALLAVIAPHYPLMEDSLYEVASMRNFAGLELNDDRIPDESTILQFRHLLERHHLTQGLFEAVEGHLREQGYHLSKGTMVDATLIQAPGSTKNKAGQRDQEMRSTRKGGWSVSLPNRSIILACRRLLGRMSTAVRRMGWR